MPMDRSGELTQLGAEGHNQTATGDGVVDGALDATEAPGRRQWKLDLTHETAERHRQDRQDRQARQGREGRQEKLIWNFLLGVLGALGVLGGAFGANSCLFIFYKPANGKRRRRSCVAGGDAA